LIQTLWWITKKDVKRFFDEYKENNPNIKISKKEFEVFSQPIDASTFSVRAKVDNREYKINKIFDGKWYLITAPGQSLFTIKPNWIKDGELSYEPWLFYIWDGDQKTKSVPIKISLDSNWDYFLEDIYGQALSGWCAIWVDGHLYAIDQDGNVLWKDGKKEKIRNKTGSWAIGLDKNKYLFFWDFSIDGMKKDVLTSSSYISFDVMSWSDKMLSEKYESKSAFFEISFQQNALHWQWYKLTQDWNKKNFILEMDGFVSWRSPDILDIDIEDFDRWLLKAKEEINLQLEKKQLHLVQYRNKEKAFNNFIMDFVDDSLIPISWTTDTYLLSSKNSNFSKLWSFTWRYWIKKRDSLNDEQPAYITIVDLETGNHLNEWTQPMFHITNW
jgi:hypothetical protein